MLEKERSVVHTVTGRLGTNLKQSKKYWHCGFVTHSECSCEGSWGIGVQGETPHVFPNFELACDECYSSTEAILASP